MNNYNLRSALSRASHYGNPLLALLAVLALSSCGKSPEQPAPPQGPPKPQVMTKAFSSDVQRAVFSYSSKPTKQFENAQGVKIVRHVIHT
jgi:hypothetical protein